MINFFKNLFDQIFPLKDDPRRAMDVIYQRSIEFGRAITEVLANTEKDKQSLAYVLSNSLEQYYTDEVNHTLIELGLDPSRVTENELKRHGASLFKSAITNMLSNCPYFYEITENSSDTIIEAFDTHMLNHDIEWDMLFPNHSQMALSQTPADKVLRLFTEAFNQQSLSVIAFALEQGFLLSVIPVNKQSLIEQTQIEFGMDFSITPFLHPLYFDFLPTQHDFKTLPEEKPVYEPTPINEIPIESESNNHYLNTHFESQLAQLPFVQKIHSAHRTLYPLLAIAETEKDLFMQFAQKVEQNICTIIENDIWAYLLNHHQSIQLTRIDMLTESKIDEYLADNTVFMSLSDIIMFIPFSIQIDLLDTYTLTEEIISRIEGLGIAIPKEIEDLLEEDETDFESLINTLKRFLEQHELSLIMFETGEDHSFYFVVKYANLESILSLAKLGLLKVNLM